MPSPQRGTVQLLRQVLERSNDSIVIGNVIVSGIRTALSRTQPQVVMPLTKPGVTVIFHTPGNGSPPITQPSLFSLKFQRPEAVLGPVLKNSLGESSVKSTLHGGGN